MYRLNPIIITNKKLCLTEIFIEKPDKSFDKRFFFGYCNGLQNNLQTLAVEIIYKSTFRL